ncbi:MAG: hypothetical protein CVU89_07050 [Firmicutes bacterium HGW-Firmicutes-14]|nr:MAG: hypothetical protein CVU89_07050 [Firmicutes bacterium HGW-Firmicutes-14]
MIDINKKTLSIWKGFLSTQGCVRAGNFSQLARRKKYLITRHKQPRDLSKGHRGIWYLNNKLCRNCYCCIHYIFFSSKSQLFSL